MRVGGAAERVRFVVQQRGGGGGEQHAVGRRHVADQEFVEVPIEVAGVDAAFDHRRMPRQPFEEADVRFRADDLACRQRLAQTLQGAVRRFSSHTISLAIIGS